MRGTWVGAMAGAALIGVAGIAIAQTQPPRPPARTNGSRFSNHESRKVSKAARCPRRRRPGWRGAARRSRPTNRRRLWTARSRNGNAHASIRNKIARRAGSTARNATGSSSRGRSRPRRPPDDQGRRKGRPRRPISRCDVGSAPPLPRRTRLTHDLSPNSTAGRSANREIDGAPSDRPLTPPGWHRWMARMPTPSAPAMSVVTSSPT